MEEKITKIQRSFEGWEGLMRDNFRDVGMGLKTLEGEEDVEL